MYVYKHTIQLIVASTILSTYIYCIYYILPIRCAIPNRSAPFRVNSSEARDGIFLLIWSMLCLLMSWLHKSSRHQQPWYWQNRICNMQSCSIVNMIFFCWIKSKIWYEMWTHLLQSLKQCEVGSSPAWFMAGMEQALAYGSQLSTPRGGRRHPGHWSGTPVLGSNCKEVY